MFGRYLQSLLVSPYKEHFVKVSSYFLKYNFESISFFFTFLSNGGFYLSSVQYSTGMRLVSWYRYRIQVKTNSVRNVYHFFKL